MNVNKLFSAVFAFFVFVLIAGSVGYIVWQLISPHFDKLRNRENREVIAFHDHFDLNPDVPNIVLEGQRLRDIPPPVIHNGLAYLPVAFVREYIDPFMFWDRGIQTLFVTTRHEMRTYRHGDIRVINGEPFVPADLLMRLYPFTVEYHTEYNMVVVTDDRLPLTTAAVSSQTPVRYRPEVTAPITLQLSAGERVTLIHDNDDGYWTRVRTNNGLLGYVQTSVLGVSDTRFVTVDRTPVLNHFIDNTLPRTPDWPEGYKINLIWENLYSVSYNNTLMQTPLHESLTVVSPTWFRFNPETKELDSIASAAYVQWAQAQGVLVWPNVTDTSANPGITDILSDATARQRIVEQLVHYTDTLNLDGLCINIENIWDFRYGPYFVQFIRELNIALGNRITIAAAMKVCPFINAHYRHDLIAKTIDFIALMTYDENYRTPGPVASQPWVNRQIVEMLNHVPANQLLMGIPFYNRVWRTRISDNSRLTSLHWDMDRAVTEFFNRGITWEDPDNPQDVYWVWEENAGSYHAEFAAVIDGEATVRHQLWLECERSVEAKLQIYVQYNLAGIAGWNNGFTNQGVWELLGRYFLWNPRE